MILLFPHPSGHIVWQVKLVGMRKVSARKLIGPHMVLPLSPLSQKSERYEYIFVSWRLNCGQVYNPPYRYSLVSSLAVTLILVIQLAVQRNCEKSFRSLFIGGVVASVSIFYFG